jgi:phosphoribosylformylglycinamidine synthase
MSNLALQAVKDVRIGKHIQLHIEASSAEEARKIADEACKKLLANPIMESYELTIHEA